MQGDYVIVICSTWKTFLWIMKRQEVKFSGERMNNFKSSVHSISIWLGIWFELCFIVSKYVRDHLNCEKKKELEILKAWVSCVYRMWLVCLYLRLGRKFMGFLDPGELTLITWKLDSNNWQIQFSLLQKRFFIRNFLFDGDLEFLLISFWII